MTKHIKLKYLFFTKSIKYTSWCMDECRFLHQGANELNLSYYENGGINVTGFQLVDSQNETHQRFLDEWNRVERQGAGGDSISVSKWVGGWVREGGWVSEWGRKGARAGEEGMERANDGGKEGPGERVSGRGRGGGGRKEGYWTLCCYHNVVG